MAQERVLIIEDSSETQQLLAELVLEPNGYRAIAALDGAEGIQLAVEEQPDLIILDMKLPKLDGLEVLQALRQRGINTPVIFTTIRESPELVVQAFRLGARDYVMKPFGPNEMVEAIQRVFSADKLIEERDQLTQQLLEANQQLERQLQELNAIYTIGRSVTSVLDLNRVLNRVVEAAVYVAGAEEGLLMLLDSTEEELYLRAAKNMEEKVARSLRVLVDDSIAGRAIQSNRPVLVSGERTKIVTGYLAQALLYLPLQVPERGVIGVLGVINRQSERSFSEKDIFLLSALADYAAIAIENARLFESAEIERTKLETVLQQTQDVIIIVDEQNNILLCNAAAHDVLDLDEATSPHEAVTDDIPNQTLRSMFTQVQQTGQVVHTEAALDDDRTFNAQLTPIKGVGHMLVMQDITHLKELDRIKSEFVANVSHDLRTPLTSIQGYVELLPRVGPVNERQQEFIQYVHDNMQTITELIDSLLDIDRIEAGFDLETLPYNLVQVIDDAVQNLRPRAEQKAQELAWQPPSTLPLVQCNPDRLQQALDNLLSNAIKYTQEGGRITVSAAGGEEHVVVSVADNGIGIPPAQQPYIFDKFYRVESEETISIVGSGLGLAIVKTVIEKHNGRVWVESKPGQGSVFSFVLPTLGAHDEAQG
ncbi:MAG: ATP-binding protein [Chloroflexota bacterium]|nr:ATP-binding protein [Chloroflexota bacterium]